MSNSLLILLIFLWQRDHFFHKSESGAAYRLCKLLFPSHFSESRVSGSVVKHSLSGLVRTPVTAETPRPALQFPGLSLGLSKAVVLSAPHSQARSAATPAAESTSVCIMGHRLGPETPAKVPKPVTCAMCHSTTSLEKSLLQPESKHLAGQITDAAFHWGDHTAWVNAFLCFSLFVKNPPLSRIWA